MRRILSHLRSNVVAWVALFFALAGTGAAASRYVITNTDQIKPSVLSQLRAETIASAAKAAKKGAHSIVARAQSVGAVSLSEEPQPVGLAGATWTQGAEEVDEIMGEVSLTATTPCSSTGIHIDVLVNGTEGNGFILPPETAGTFTTQLVWPQKLAPLAVLTEPGKATPSTITATAATSCSGITLNSVSVDVIGAR